MTEFLEEGEDPGELLSNFLSSEEKEDAYDALYERLCGLISHLDDIDNLINTHADGWKTSRIAKVDLALLRLAIYEMTREDLSKGIAINEAVELAKLYGEDRSYAFINGILARI